MQPSHSTSAANVDPLRSEVTKAGTTGPDEICSSIFEAPSFSSWLLLRAFSVLHHHRSRVLCFTVTGSEIASMAMSTPSSASSDAAKPPAATRVPPGRSDWRSRPGREYAASALDLDLRLLERFCEKVGPQGSFSFLLFGLLVWQGLLHGSVSNVVLKKDTSNTRKPLVPGTRTGSGDFTYQRLLAFTAWT